MKLLFPEGERLYLPDWRTLRVATVGLGQPVGIAQELFDQIIATFRLAL